MSATETKKKFTLEDFYKNKGQHQWQWTPPTDKSDSQRTNSSLESAEAAQPKSSQVYMKDESLIDQIFKEKMTKQTQEQEKMTKQTLEQEKSLSVA